MKNYLFALTVSLLLCNVINSSSFANTSAAKVQLLNKRTGLFVVTNIAINSVYRFDNKLFVLVKSCLQSSKQDDPENIAFFQIAKLHFSTNENQKIPSLNSTLSLPIELYNAMPVEYNKYFIFSGFMYSSSPSANALEDSIYDITLLECV